MPGHRFGRNLPGEKVLGLSSCLFARRGEPDHIRSDDGTGFTAKMVRSWLGRVGVWKLFIEPGSRWENACFESLNGKPSNELPGGKILDALPGAEVLVERFRVRYNTVLSHSSLGRQPPVPDATRLRMPDFGTSLS